MPQRAITKSMDLSPAIATTLVAILGVPVFMALMRRVRTLQHRPDSKKSFARLAREYARWEVLAVLLSLPITGVIAYLLHCGLESVYRLQLSHQQPGLFTASLPSAGQMALHFSARHGKDFDGDAYDAGYEDHMKQTIY